MGVTVIVGTEKGAFVCRSSDRKAWQVEGPQFKGWKATASARTPGGRWLLATSSRVYGAALHASPDLESWSQIEQGPAWPDGGERKMNQIWTLRAAGERLYAGVDVAGLFSSDDDGETWQPVEALNEHESRESWFPGAGGLCAHHVLIDPKDPRRIWVGMSAVGLWHSADGGATWELRNEGVRQVIEDKKYKDIGYCVHGVIADPDDADTIYRQDHAGFYATTDGGQSWEKRMEGMPSWFGFPVAMDPNTKRLFAFPMESDEFRMPVEGRFRVYVSDDGAATWQERGEGLPSHPMYAGVLRTSLATDGAGGVYVGSTSGDVFASADNGDTWQQLPCTMPRVLSVQAYADG